MLKKKFGDKEVKCLNCHQKVKPLIELNRAKSEFIGVRYTGKDRVYWLICLKCKTIIGTK